MNVCVYVALSAALLGSLTRSAAAQATAPSGALSPAAPANPAPTTDGANSATPAASPGAAKAGVPQSPAAAQSSPGQSAPGQSAPASPALGDLAAPAASQQPAQPGQNVPPANPVAAPAAIMPGSAQPAAAGPPQVPTNSRSGAGSLELTSPTAPASTTEGPTTAPTQVPPSQTAVPQPPAAVAPQPSQPAAAGVNAPPQAPNGAATPTAPAVTSPAAPQAAPQPATSIGAPLAVPSEGQLAGAAAATGQPPAQPAAASGITLAEAIKRAQGVDHNYVSAVVDEGTARAEKTIARADLLPNVDYHNQVIYTQPQRPYNATATVSSNNQTVTSAPAPIFIANNAVREYVSQGVVTETIGLGRLATLRKAYADEAVAKAKLEIARRGLVATVVGAYYGLLAAQAKQQVAAQALDEANRFLKVTQQLEAGGEAAHADVLKAQLEQNQRDRDLQDAALAALKARLDLGVLLLPDPTQPYTLAADLNHPPALATQDELRASAHNASPDVRAALASVQSAEAGIAVSRAAYFPDLSLAYNYGIDSDHFAIHDANGVRNLGYAATATLDIPVWDWFATSAKIRQSRLALNLAKADLTAAQRRALAAFQEFYGEAEVANHQLASLDRSVADAAEALRLVSLKYAAGEGSVLEVVDAQNTLVTAEQARADGVVRYFTALASLQTLTGNLP